MTRLRMRQPSSGSSDMKPQVHADGKTMKRPAQQLSTGRRCSTACSTPQRQRWSCDSGVTLDEKRLALALCSRNGRS